MMADMPLAVATQASAPSSAARRCSKALTVGLEKREYTLPASSPEKRRAAWAAFSKTKLEVRYSASPCSPNWLRSCPARTAKVGSCHAAAVIPALRWPDQAPSDAKHGLRRHL